MHVVCTVVHAISSIVMVWGYYSGQQTSIILIVTRFATPHPDYQQTVPLSLNGTSFFFAAKPSMRAVVSKYSHAAGFHCELTDILWIEFG